MSRPPGHHAATAQPVRGTAGLLPGTTGPARDGATVVPGRGSQHGRARNVP
jgi:hypothetical protein